MILKSQKQLSQKKEISSKQQELRFKQFQINNCKVKYQNKYEIIQIPKQEESKNLTISNHLCYLDGDILKKVSDIIVDNQIIRITDSFSFQQMLFKFQNKDQIIHLLEDFEPPQRNKHLIKKRPYIPGFSEEKPMTYKNTIKNIVRLFMTWLRTGDLLDKLSLIKRIQGLVSKKKFNNQLIISMALVPKLNKKFVQFIDSNCQQYIATSKINDKESHINSLKYYRKVMIDHIKQQSQQQE